MRAIQAALMTALQEAEAVRSQRDPSKKDTIWNPVSAALFNCLMAQLSASAPDPGGPRSRPRETKPKQGKSKAKQPQTNASASTAPAAASTAEKPKPVLKAVRPTSKSRSEARGHHPNPATLSDEDVSSIRSQISDALQKPSRHPFSAQPAVTCKAPSCKFCIAMAKHLHLSPCTIHIGPSCHPSGWWPHVGRKLWSMVKRSHDSGQNYVPKVTAPRDDQLRSIACSVQSPHKRKCFAPSEGEPADWSECEEGSIADSQLDESSVLNSPAYSPTP